MELKDPPDDRRRKLIPVVTYAVERRIAAPRPDYWDHATLLELAVLGRDGIAADKALANVAASVREKWEPETTARNLRLIREARERRKQDRPWMIQIRRRVGADASPTFPAGSLDGTPFRLTLGVVIPTPSRQENTAAAS